MQIIPAIDVQNGQCVRLYQGAFDKVTRYAENPLEVALSYQQQGAKTLHVVDLDGARFQKSNFSENFALFSDKLKIPMQIGGGIRTASQIEYFLQKGVSRVVIGSLAVNNPQLVQTWLEQFNGKVVLALDVKCNTQGEPFLVTQGWQYDSQISLWALLESYQDTSLKYVLCTDIEKDGALNGPNFTLYESCQQRYPKFCWQASGGVQSLSDLIALQQLGVNAVIVGKAFYERKFSLEEALKVVQ